MHIFITFLRICIKWCQNSWRVRKYYHAIVDDDHRLPNSTDIEDGILILLNLPSEANILKHQVEFQPLGHIRCRAKLYANTKFVPWVSRCGTRNSTNIFGKHLT